jgi:hypothetical protein
MSWAIPNKVTANYQEQARLMVALFTESITGANKNASESYNSGTWASNEVGSQTAVDWATL